MRYTAVDSDYSMRLKQRKQYNKRQAEAISMNAPYIELVRTAIVYLIFSD